MSLFSILTLDFSPSDSFQIYQDHLHLECALKAFATPVEVKNISVFFLIAHSVAQVMPGVWRLC